MVFQPGGREGTPLNDPGKSIISNPWAELACRWLLGAIFLVASFHKIINPAQFAKIIYGYQLVPDPAINLTAILLPFLELVAGAALMAGLFPRSAAVIINGMLGAFIIAISINLLRGHTFDCGCFSISDAGSSAVGGLLIRDLVCFAMGGYIIWYKHPRKWCLAK